MSKHRAFATVLVAAVALGVVAALAHATTRGRGGTIVTGIHVAGKPARYIAMWPDGTHQRTLPSSANGCEECLRLSWNGRRVLTHASAPDGRITGATFNIDGTGYRVLTIPDPTLNLEQGAWSRDGSRIAFEGADDSKPARDGLYTVDSTSGGNLRRIINPHGDPQPLRYSPDGLRILFLLPIKGGPEDSFDLYAVQLDGTGLARLNPPRTTVDVKPIYGDPATWSSDGQAVAFAAFARSAGAGRSAVFVVNADGTDRRRITSWGDWTTSAHWSPNGRWIAYDKNTIGGHDIFLMRPDGSQVKKIVTTNVDGGACCAVWSPDDTHLLFQRGPGEKATLWTVRADGSQLKRLVKTPGIYAHYEWGR